MPVLLMPPARRCNDGNGVQYILREVLIVVPSAVGDTERCSVGSGGVSLIAWLVHGSYVRADAYGGGGDRTTGPGPGCRRRRRRCCSPIPSHRGRPALFQPRLRPSDQCRSSAVARALVQIDISGGGTGDVHQKRILYYTLGASANLTGTALPPKTLYTFKGSAVGMYRRF